MSVASNVTAAKDRWRAGGERGPLYLTLDEYLSIHLDYRRPYVDPRHRKRETDHPQCLVLTAASGTCSVPVVITDEPSAQRTVPAETWTGETYKARERWRWVGALSEATIFAVSRYLSNVGAENARAAGLAAYGEYVDDVLHGEKGVEVPL